jgi:F0F1-type ATP synthase alpha subunit
MKKLQFVLPKKVDGQQLPSISKDTGRVISISDGVVRVEGLFAVLWGLPALKKKENNICSNFSRTVWLVKVCGRL